MTTTAKSKTSKASKTSKPSKTVAKAINGDIAKDYAALVNQGGEVQFILKVADMMAAGLATVRSTQDSIASVKGTAPTIRKSHAQWFTIAAEIIRTHEDAFSWPMSEILKLAERVGRNHGSDKAAEIISESESLADLGDKSPTQAKAKADKAAAPAALTLESVIASSNAALRKVINGKNLRDVSTEDLQTLKALIGTLVTIAKTTEAKAKAKA